MLESVHLLASIGSKGRRSTQGTAFIGTACGLSGCCSCGVVGVLTADCRVLAPPLEHIHLQYLHMTDPTIVTG